MASFDDFEQQQLDLMQRRNKAREGQTFRPLEGQMVSGRYVAPHWTQALAEGLRGYSDIQAERKAEQGLSDLRTERKNAMANALDNFIKRYQGSAAVPEKSETFGSEEGDYKMVTQPAKAAVAADPTGAMVELLRSGNPAFQSAGMTGFINEQKIKADNARDQSHLRILASTNTPQEAIAAGVPIEKVKGFYESGNFGRTKVGKTIEIEGTNGQKMIQMVDEYGQPVGAPTPGYMPAQAVNTGNAVTFAKPVAGQSFTVNMAPGDVAKLNQAERHHQASLNAPIFNADAGGFVYKPTAQNPQGGVVKVEGVGNKPLTEGQAKAVAFGTRMQNADQILNDLGLSGTNAIIPGANSALMNPLLSKNQQKAVQAQRDFVNATLRRESGAVISDQEFNNAAKQYFPQVGDSKEVIEQKAKNRRIAIGGIMADIPQGSQGLPNQIIQGSKPSGGVIDFGSLK
jgi:hypothetical protein